MKENPYSVLFGKEPHQIIKREAEAEDILSSFCAEHSPQMAYIIVGPRGSGKTVLLGNVISKLRQRDNWVVVELNPERNLLESLMNRLYSEKKFQKIFTGAKINLSFFGIGVDIGGAPPILDEEVAVERMLESLHKKGKRVLIAIDEAVSTPAMRVFIHSYQIFIRQNLPLYLLMTGLWHNIDRLQNEKSLTFLYRASKIRLQPLSLRMIAQNYKKVFQLPEKDVNEMAELTKGYSFGFQVLGYLTFEHDGDYCAAKEEYRRYLADYVYDKIWSELSEQDRAVMRAVAMSKREKIADIRGELEMDTNHFNPYRKRLIQRGLLSGEQYGCLYFVLPCFREYILYDT